MESVYENQIIYIRNKKTDEVFDKGSFSIKSIISIYSNTKIPIFKLVLNNIPISRNNTYTVRYKCSICNIYQEITLNLFVRKINKGIQRCESCRNKDEIKRKKQSDFMKTNASTIIKGDYVQIKNVSKTLSLNDYIERSTSDWIKEDDEFKENYFLRHLTVDDFERIRSKIIGINNDKFKNISDWTYFPTYRVYNQTRYTPMFINLKNNSYEKPLYITFKCDNCDGIFKHRDLHIIKNLHKLLCQRCSFSNKIFKIRKYRLKNGNTILWQSIPEKRFIEWCEEYSIQVKNGPDIQYMFKNKLHTYRVDFELSDYKMLIEIKDNHHWHIQQVESGKFQLKENAAKDWCTRNGYTYHVIFPKTIQRFKDSILSRKTS